MSDKTLLREAFEALDSMPLSALGHAVETRRKLRARLAQVPERSKRDRALTMALREAIDGLMFAADSMERGGCWCGGYWRGPHHDYCKEQRARVRKAERALKTE